MTRKKKKLTIEHLADLITQYPNATFQVDNDGWNMVMGECQICSSDCMGFTENGYGSGPNYGGDILQALALLVGVKVESV